MEREQGLSKPTILSIALILVDEQGLEAVTMRRIAEATGLTAMSLYRHVRTKEEIIDGLRELAWDLLDFEPDDAAHWRDQLFETFKHVHAALVTHPGVIDILLLRPVDSLTAYRTLERWVAGLCNAGFSRQSAALALTTLESYTLGFAIQQRMRIGRDVGADAAAVGALPPEEFPHLSRSGPLVATWTSDEWFEAGLERQISALEHDLARS